MMGGAEGPGGCQQRIGEFLGGGGGLNIFCSGPKCPPRYGFISSNSSTRSQNPFWGSTALWHGDPVACRAQGPSKPQPPNRT